MDEKKKVDKLKIVFSVLKEFSDGNTPKHDDYGIEKHEFNDILDAIQDDGLIKGIAFAGNSKRRVAFTEDAKITIKGMEYLHDNSALMKTYKGLKEVRDWIPFAY